MRGLKSLRALTAILRAGFLPALMLLMAPVLPGVAMADAPSATFVDAPASERSDLGRQMRCMALVAYAEAAVDGKQGMDAVIRVIRNRMRSGAFPSDACKVVLQPNQFQPVSENATLRQVLADPEAHAFSEAFGGIDETRMSNALVAAAASLGGVRVKDPTVGALFFVNPLFMDADKCPWFAALKKTAEIGGHVFMTQYASNEKHAEDPAIDCSIAGTAKAGGQGLPKGVGIVVRNRTANDHRRITVVLGGRIGNNLMAAR